MVRETARIILFESNKVLLLKYEDKSAFSSSNPFQKPFWVTPGGELKSQETYETAIRRELWEETGITDIEIGAWVWSREHNLLLNNTSVNFRERYYLGRTNSGNINTINMSLNERNIYKNYKWWELNELVTSNEIFFPERFLEYIIPLFNNLKPDKPIKLLGSLL